MIHFTFLSILCLCLFSVARENPRDIIASWTGDRDTVVISSEAIAINGRQYTPAIKFDEDTEIRIIHIVGEAQGIDKSNRHYYRWGIQTGSVAFFRDTTWNTVDVQDTVEVDSLSQSSVGAIGAYQTMTVSVFNNKVIGYTSDSKSIKIQKNEIIRFIVEGLEGLPSQQPAKKQFIIVREN